MKNVNEQFAEMQKKTLESLEPMKNLNSVAAEAFEKIARKNYDLMGDLLEFTVAQTKVPEASANIQDVYEERVANARAFAEKVNERAAEYVSLASELGEMVKNGPAEAAEETAEEAPVEAAAEAPAEETPVAEAPAEEEVPAAEPAVEDKPVAKKAAAKKAAAKKRASKSK